MKKNTQFLSIFYVMLVVVITSCMAKKSTPQNMKQANLSVSYKTLRIKPSEADPRVHAWDSVHVVYYDPKIKNNKILLWLTGTNGSTKNVPTKFFKTALDQGYRIVALSFMSTPGVSQLCVGNRLKDNADCAAQFRRKRTYGDNNFSGIPDQPQDAIIPRLVKLLQYLSKNDKEGHWSQYLDDQAGKPAWNRIAIAGQSQGGGMAEYIAQNEKVSRIISFSGGWDYSDSKNKKIAGWYAQKFTTPLENLYATYHTKEAAATELAEICQTIHIPKDHSFALDQPLLTEKNKSPNPYHVEGIKNPVYKPVWIKMLGSGL